MMVNSGLTTVIEPATAAVCGARAGTMHNKSYEHMALAFWLAARGLLGSIFLLFFLHPFGGVIRTGLAGVEPRKEWLHLQERGNPLPRPLPCAREPSPLASIPNECVSAHVMG